jgi:flavorubredoxin
MTDELIAGIEQILERNVIAFVSANHIDPDIAIETFILAPGDQTPPPLLSKR